MRAVVLRMPEHWLAERRRTGEDQHDEVWDGVVHMSPFAGRSHQRMSGALYALLRPLAEARGLEAFFDFGVYEPGRGDQNYRGPDVSVVRPENVSARGIEGRAELVIEVLSPYDERRDKLPFYARCGIPEVWLVEPDTREAEVYALADLALSLAAGPQLRVSWAGGASEI